MDSPNPANTTEHLWYEEVALPVLLRHGRATYATAMRKALAEAGYDDIPGNGLYLIGGLALEREDIQLGELIKDLRVSKQAAGQLVDTLVTRGYLDRQMDKNDRRKLTVTLTERGRAAAAVQSAARQKVDLDLLECVGQEDISRTRRTLAALANMIRGEAEDEG